MPDAASVVVLELSPDAEKQDLWEEIQRLRRELEKKKRELDEYKKRHPETVGVKHGKAYAIPTPLAPRQPSGNKPGGQPGHAGASRPAPTLTNNVRLRLRECPDCDGHNLSRIQEKRQRTVEDVATPQPVATQYTIERRYCRDCEKLVEPVVPGALKGARIGLRAMLMVAWLRIACRLPEDAVAKVMSSTQGLTISTGEVQNILDQIADAYGPTHETLLSNLRERATKHIDETSWRTNGQNQYLWAFVTEWEAIYTVHESRAHEVPLAVLGDHPQGTIVVDGHSAYRTLATKTDLKLQRCWAHVLGDAKELAQFYGAEGQAILDGLKPIYAKAKSHFGAATPHQLARLHDDLKAVLERPFKSNHCARFARNHLRHADDLFRFATNPIDGTNNRAERAIRPLVVARKISGGSRSQKGANVRAILASIQQTFQLRGVDFLQGPGIQPIPTSTG